MSKRQWLLIIGIGLVIVPFLGFPQNGIVIITILCGAMIFSIAYSMAPKENKNTASSITYVEHHAEPIRDSVTTGSPMISTSNTPENITNTDSSPKQ